MSAVPGVKPGVLPVLLLLFTIIKCLLVNGINGETEDDSYGS